MQFLNALASVTDSEKEMCHSYIIFVNIRHTSNIVSTGYISFINETPMQWGRNYPEECNQFVT